MKMAVGRWASRVASRHNYVFLASNPMTRNTRIHHSTSMLCTLPPVPVSLCQGNTWITVHPAYRVDASKRPPQSWWRGPRQLMRCFHTGERNWDEVTNSMGEHSSSLSGSSVVEEVVKQWTQNLDKAEVPEAHLSAQHIVAHVIGVNRSDLQTHNTARATLTEHQLAEIDRLMNCRLARMPLQYILGEWDFHCLTLKMVPPVFIPRPETELLVELAIKTLRELEAPRVFEIGCGSGAISLALLHALPQVECVAVDQSKHAVELTKTNASRLRLSGRLTVVEGKVTLGSRPPLPHSSYDLVVSNPPYVLRKDLMEVQPEIMMYEDLRALDGGKDGLEVVKAVLRHANQLLSPGRTLLLEVDPCHPYLLPTWLEKEEMDLKLLQVHKDFNKKERFMEFIKTQ